MRYMRRDNTRLNDMIRNDTPVNILFTFIKEHDSANYIFALSY